MEITPSGHFAKLYQFLVREPPSLPEIDTILVGSFLPHRGRKRLWQGVSRGISRNCMVRTTLLYIENPAQAEKVSVCAGPFYPARAFRQIVSIRFGEIYFRGIVSAFCQMLG